MTDPDTTKPLDAMAHHVLREGEADAFGQRRGAGSEQTGLVEHDVSCHADKFRGADQSFQTRRIKTLR